MRSLKRKITGNYKGYSNHNTAKYSSSYLPCVNCTKEKNEVKRSRNEENNWRMRLIMLVCFTYKEQKGVGITGRQKGDVAIMGGWPRKERKGVE